MPTHLPIAACMYCISIPTKDVAYLHPIASASACLCLRSCSICSYVLRMFRLRSCALELFTDYSINARDLACPCLQLEMKRIAAGSKNKKKSSSMYSLYFFFCIYTLSVQMNYWNIPYDSSLLMASSFCHCFGLVDSSASLGLTRCVFACYRCL
jgi:hypothetical protein